LLCICIFLVSHFAQADWFEDQFKGQYPCSLPRIRRAWSDLTPDQQRLYARAVYMLWLHKSNWIVDSPNDYSYSLYDVIATMHGDQANGMLHRTSAFSLHHKAFLWMYESAIIYTALVLGPNMDPIITPEEACSITLPYWEWNLGCTKSSIINAKGLTETTYNWDLANTDVFKGVDVFGDTSPDPSTGYVDTGYFSPLSCGYGKDVGKPLKRKYDPSAYKSAKFETSWFASYKDFSSFVQTIHGTLHGFVHTWVGEWMAGTGNAGYDPLFYLHHCNNDRFWHIWVDCQGWEFLDESQLTDTHYKALNPLSVGNEVQTNGKDTVPFAVGLEDTVFFYVKQSTPTFLPKSVWPKLKQMWSTGTLAKRGWNGLFYRYGPDKMVTGNFLTKCKDQTWSLVNQRS